MTALTIRSTIRLNNDVHIPVLGYGTYQIKGDTAYPATLAALKAGYRHIDTAAVYQNEEAVGRAIRDSGLRREDLFVTSKLGPKDHGEDPGHVEKRRESWRAFEKLYTDGKCRAIGVSNYLVHHLEDLLAQSSVVPAVNQVEYHPLLQYKDLRKFCDEKGILLEAYSSIGQGKLLTNEVAAEIGLKNGKSVAQILLRWGLQKGTVILPKSVNEERIKENAALFDWELDAEEMKRLGALDKDYHFCWDPNGIP